MLNAVMMGRGAITNGVSNAVQPTSISQVLAEMGVRVDSKGLIGIGRIAARLYQEKHGETPSKHTQLVNGQALSVNNYFECDRELLRTAVKEHLEHGQRAESGSRKLDQWFAPRA